MSHVKAGGTAKNVHNNAGQRLGVKRFGGQKVKNGEVLVRQTGATKLAGPGTYMSRNFTIHAAKDGVVTFVKTKKTHFSGKSLPRVRVEPRRRQKRIADTRRFLPPNAARFAPAAKRTVSVRH